MRGKLSRKQGEITRTFQIGDAVRPKHSRGYPGERGEVIGIETSHDGGVMYTVKYAYALRPHHGETGETLMPWDK